MKKKTVTQKQFSADHIRYLKKLRGRTAVVWTLGLGILAAALLLWQILADTGAIDVFIGSSPKRIAATIVDLVRNDNLFYHIGITLYETIVGFLIAVALGTFIALLLWWSEIARRVCEPYLIVLNALPKIALGPIIIVWCGSGSKSIILMAVLIGIIVTVINMLNGFLAADKDKILLLRSMGATKFQILRKLVLPGSVKTFIGTLKIDVGMAWIGSVMGEYMTSKAGIGYLIVYGGQVFKLDLVMAATAVLCVLATMMYLGVALLEKLLVKNRS